MKPPGLAPSSEGFQPAVGALWLGYLCFVVYGSLVPFDFKLIPWEQALSRYSQIALLVVGAEGRADWVANGILYVPVGFLTALSLLGRSAGWVRGFVAAACALCFSLALAVGIEFAQLYFPPRTVSLNDLLAEAAGAAVGVFLAPVGVRAFRTLLTGVADSTRVPGRWLLWGYALLYLAFSLFPLDFVLSASELQGKIASPSWGWWMAQSVRGEALWSTIAKPLAELLMAAPIGLLWATSVRTRSKPSGWIAGATGITVAIAIELLQFLLISGISQGISVLARACGFGLGLWAFGRAHLFSVPRVQAIIRRYAPLLAMLYLPVLAGVSGLFTSPWRGAAAAMRRLTNEVVFTPFFYHYFTTEARALFSLAAVSMLYVPVGLLAWAFRWSPWLAMVMASLLAAAIEGGKLFPATVRPDPTNIWIAGVSAFMTVKALRLWAARLEPTGGAHRGSNTAPLQRVLLPVVALCMVLAWVSEFPTYRVGLATIFVLYAVALWRNPLLQFSVVPASIPLLDLAPFSGRFFLDEFDWLILIGLAIGYTRLAVAPTPARRWRLASALALAVTVTFAVGSWRALTPLQWPDANAFNSYLSPLNALRVAKGALWAVLLLPLMIRAQAAGDDLHRRFAVGLVVGLSGTVLAILWERASFSSLMYFSYPYRVSGPISAMHIGGAYLECYLTVAIAYLIALLTRVQAGSRHLLVFGGLLLVGAAYAVMVTYSRGGYLAIAVVGMLMLFANLRRPQSMRHTLVAGAVIVGVALIVAVPVWRGAFAQSRIATVERDLAIRVDHWRAAMALRSDQWQAEWFGMGVGQFPVTKYLAGTPKERSASYQLIGERGNPALRISAGRPLFMDQLVAVQPDTTYVLKLRARATSPMGKATLHICHKWQLASTDCREFQLALQQGASKWTNLEQSFHSGPLGADPWYARRPVKLTLQSADQGAIDFDDVQLLSPTGDNLLKNGDFSGGLDHWHFTSDEHLAWHVKQIGLAVLFDLGVFGLVVMGVLTILVVWRAARDAWRGGMAQAASLAALSAFIAVGLFDSLVDAPRFLFLFLTVCWLALTVAAPQQNIGNKSTPARS